MFEELDNNFNIVQRAWPGHTPGFPEKDQSLKDYFQNHKNPRKIDLRMTSELISRYHDNFLAMVMTNVAKLIAKIDKDLIKEDQDGSLGKPSELFTRLSNAGDLDKEIDDPATHETWRIILQQEVIANYQHVCDDRLKTLVENEMTRIDPGFKEIGTVLTFAKIRKFVEGSADSFDPALNQMYQSCIWRRVGETWQEWSGRVLATHASAGQHFTLPESAWVDMLWRQMQSAERVVTTKQKTLKKMHELSVAHATSKFPFFRPDFKILANMAMIPTPSMLDTLKGEISKGKKRFKTKEPEGTKKPPPRSSPRLREKRKHKEQQQQRPEQKKQGQQRLQGKKRRTQEKSKSGDFRRKYGAALRKYMDENLCFRCGKKGHKSGDCKAQGPPPDDSPLRFKMKPDGTPVHQFSIAIRNPGMKVRKSTAVKFAQPAVPPESWMMENPKPLRLGGNAIRVSMQAMVGDEPREINVLLDSGADINIIHVDIAQQMTPEIISLMPPNMAAWASETAQRLNLRGPQRANVCGSTTTFARVGAVRVLTEKHPTDGVWLPGYVTSDVRQLPHECLLVVDPDGIYEGLGISLDETYAARRRERKKNARSLGEPNTCESKNSDPSVHWESVEIGKGPTMDPYQDIPELVDAHEADELPLIFLSEAQVRDFLTRHPDGGFSKEETALEDALNLTKCVFQGLSEGQKDEFRKELLLRRSVFSEVKGFSKVNNAKPYVIPLKEEHKIVRLPRPKFPETSAKTQYLRLWANHKLKEGTWEKSPRSLWAQYMHLAYKSKIGKPHQDPDWKIRPCVATVGSNAQQHKMPPNTPNMRDEVAKHKGCKIFWKLDGTAWYHQTEYDEKSRDVVSIWTPIGLIRPIRMQFGDVNAGNVAQANANETLSRLPEDSRKRISNYQDDFMGGAPNFETALRDFLALLDEAEKDGHSFDPTSIRFGFPEIEFAGFLIGQDGKYKMHPKHMDVEKLKEPRNKQELQHLLGVLNIHKNFHDSSVWEKVEPIQSLMKAKTKWKPTPWGPEQSAALDFIKTKIKENPELHSPDFSRRMYTASDASDTRISGVLFQLDSEVRDELLAKVSRDQMQVICYYTKRMSEALRKKPIYYKEAAALFTTHWKFFHTLELSPFAIASLVDQMSLKWVKHSHKGLVTAWLHERVTARLDWYPVYSAGTSQVMSYPDSLTRVQMITSETPEECGLKQMLHALLKHAPDSWKQIRSVWVWAQANTLAMARWVQEWRDGRNVISKSSPKGEPSYELAILFPKIEYSPIVAYSLLEKNKPFAILMPADLTQYIPESHGGQKGGRDPVIQERLRKTSKIMFTSNGLMWIASHLPQGDEIFAAEQDLRDDEWIPDLMDFSEHAAVQFSVKSDRGEESTPHPWAKDQQDQLAKWTKEFGKDQIAIRDDGLALLTQKGKQAKVLVPDSRLRDLLTDIHLVAHRALKGTMAKFREKYYAKPARRVAQEIINQCDCIAGKVNAMPGDRQFHALQYTRPYIAAGIDWYEIAKSEEGNTGGWSMVDPFQRFWMFQPAKEQTGHTAARALLDRFILKTGALKALISDAHRSLVGSTTQSLCDAGQTQKITTHRWSPANGITERPHEFLGLALRCIPPEKRKHWDKEISKMEFAYNAQYNSSLGTSPFQMRYGYPPIFPFEADLIEDIPEREFDDTTVDGRYGKIAQSLKSYSEAAAAASRELRDLENQKLNDHGYARSYEVGDRVWIFAPPRPSIDWKIKHEKHWRPAVVTERLSNSYYKCTAEDGRTFTRKGALIRPNRSPQSNAPPKPKRKRKKRQRRQKQPAEDAVEDAVEGQVDEDAVEDAVENQVEEDCSIAPDEVTVGDNIITIDEPGLGAVEIARVTEITEEGVHAHYYGTTDPSLATAKFSPAYVDNRGRTILGRKPRKREKAKPYSGIIPQDAELILGRAHFTKSSQLTTATRRYLHYLKKTHKYMPSKRPVSRKAPGKGSKGLGGMSVPTRV